MNHKTLISLYHMCYTEVTILLPTLTFFSQVAACSADRSDMNDRNVELISATKTFII